MCLGFPHRGMGYPTGHSGILHAIFDGAPADILPLGPSHTLDTKYSVSEITGTLVLTLSFCSLTPPPTVLRQSGRYNKSS